MIHHWSLQLNRKLRILNLAGKWLIRQMVVIVLDRRK